MRRDSPWLRGLRAVAMALFVGSALGFVAVRVLFDSYEMPSEAMEPSLERGDRILVLRSDTGVSRGDMVVYEYEQQKIRIGRVVAVGGDVVEAGLDERLLVNGQGVDEDYLGDAPATASFDPVDVPEGQVFVAGDNRPNSMDSRYFGPIPADSVRGTVAAVNVPVDLILLASTVLTGLAGLVLTVVLGRHRPVDTTSPSLPRPADPAHG